jgi:methyl-accepting chemotaxis protein
MGVGAEAMKWLTDFLSFRWFFNIKMTWKLIIIIVFLSMAGISAGLFASNSLNSLSDQTSKMFAKNVQGFRMALYLRLDLAEIQYNMFNTVNRGDVSAASIVEVRLERIDTIISDLKRMTDEMDSALDLESAWNDSRERFVDFTKNPSVYVNDIKGRQLLQTLTRIINLATLIEIDIQKIGVEAFNETKDGAVEQANTVLILIIIMLGIAIVIGVFTILAISGPLGRLRQAMIGLAKGNMQLPMLPASKDEIGETASAYETSIRQLREMIGRVSDVTSSLTEIVGELSPQIDATGTAAEMVSQTMNELSKGTQETARAADEVACTIHSIVEQIDRANSKAQIIANYSTTVIAEAKQGEEDTKAILNQVNELAGASNKATDVIHDLEEHSHQIEEIIGKIREITEQTQLLSLNASIEAARAGEFGRGFGVVANEVGKLAQKSAQAVQDVELVLGNIQGMVMDAVHVMEEGVSKANDGKKMIAETSGRFNQIFGSINKVAAEIQEVADETSKLTVANQRVLEEIDTIAAISEQTAANTQEVLATVDSQASSVGEVSDGMKKLNEASEDLKHSVSKFRL